jgi:hypothetical protein
MAPPTLLPAAPAVLDVAPDAPPPELAPALPPLCAPALLLDVAPAPAFCDAPALLAPAAPAPESSLELHAASPTVDDAPVTTRT